MLIAGAMAIYILVLWAHSLRHRFGPAYFYALIGALTAIMSWVTDAGATVTVGDITFVIGSTVFYTSLLLSVFVVYVFDGPRMTRVAISTVLFVSILTPLIAASLHMQTPSIGSAEIALIPMPDLRINTASALATLVDFIFLAVAWEFLGKPVFNLKLWFRSYATLLGVMWLDVLLFATGAFMGTPEYLNILAGTLISRFIISLAAFPFLYVYLYWQNRRNDVEIENRPVLAILRRVAEAESELSDIRREMEQRKVVEAALIKSETLLEATGRMAKVGGWELEADTREVFWTHEMYRIHEEPVGKKLSMGDALAFFHPEDKIELNRAIDRAFDMGQPYDLELRITTAKGKGVWVRTIGNPQLSGGKTTKLTGTFQDISDRKQTEIALHKYRENLEVEVAKRTQQVTEAKQQWEHTFDTISDWVSILDKNHIILRSNKASAELTGRSPKQVVGKHCYEVLHGIPCPIPNCPTQRALASKQRESTEIHLNDGRWLQVSVDLLNAHLIDSEKVVHIVRDITEHKRSEEKLRQAHKMEAIGTLTGGIAHEFNNMLGIILGNTELAIDDIPELDPATEYLAEIRTASLRAKDVVQKLMRVARQGPTSRKTIQISKIVKEALSLLKRTIPATIDIRPNLRCQTEIIIADATEMHQVMINLCLNASHAMGGETGILEIGLEAITLDTASLNRYEDLQPGDYASLTVKDTGEGISPDIMDRIFDPYFTTKDVDEGLGMGLAVVQGIVKKHGGAITVESEPGKGTTVEVLFPLVEAQTETGEKETERLPTGSERILLVDDEASMLGMVKQMIERFGYEVIAKTGGREALELFREDPAHFDLVITDMTMPDVAGDRLAQEIIRIQPDTRIILYTGHSDHMDENKAHALGIRSFVMKPLTKKYMAETIRRVLDEDRNPNRA